MAKKTVSSKALSMFSVYMLICVGVIVVVLTLDNFGVFNNIEYKSWDLRFRIRGIEPHNDDIIIVGIDEQTLDLLGIFGMPPRDFHVDIIENLYRAGAKAVLFDVEFFSYVGEKGSGDKIGNIPAPEDSMLALTLKKYPNTVIARKQQRTKYVSTTKTAGESHLPPELFRNPSQLAFVDMYQDSDSFIRRTQLISNDLDPAYGWNYSFALKAAMFAMNADTAWVDHEKHLAYVGDKVIPLNNNNFMYINYPMDEKTYQDMRGYISYEQVWDDSEYGIEILVTNNRIKDKVVLVGAAWPESFDVHRTPFYLGNTLYSTQKHDMYGVHVHKSIITTILEERFIPPVKRWQFVSLVIFMAVLATLLNWKFRGFLGLLGSVLILLFYSGAAIYLFLFHRWMIPVVAPAFATVGINYMSVVTYNFLMERKQKAMIRGAFAQYVPPSVVGELLKNPDMLTLGGEERVMTVIFSDVEGFTTISETLTPVQLVELLNEYLTAMTDIVLSYNGIIDKYEGDAIMAEFGAPLPDKDHALKGCLTALDMQERLRELRKKLKSEGKPELYARVGINSGPMVIGNMGSQRIFDYTVMGDNVNLSSRLEGANKVYGTYIMCSEATRKMVENDIITRELDLLIVKGKTEGVLVHEVVAKKSDGLSREKQQMLDIYNMGLRAYKKRQWDDGIELFTKARLIDPTEQPSAVYIERCKEFKLNPPPEDWDGIFTMRTK